MEGRMLYECAKEALGEQTVIISRPEFIDRFQENGENEVYQDAEPFQGMGHWLVYIPLLKRQTVIFILFFPVTHR